MSSASLPSCGTGCAREISGSKAAGSIVPSKISAELTACTFGVPAAQARATVALIGDSHAQHWRSALAVLAKRRGWRVHDVSVPLCMFSTATTGADPPFDGRCPRWNADVLAWLASIANQLDLSLDDAMARYAQGCPSCHAAPCRCGDRY